MKQKNYDILTHSKFYSMIFIYTALYMAPKYGQFCIMGLHILRFHLPKDLGPTPVPALLSVDAAQQGISSSSSTEVVRNTLRARRCLRHCRLSREREGWRSSKRISWSIFFDSLLIAQKDLISSRSSMSLFRAQSRQIFRWVWCRSKYLR